MNSRTTSVPLCGTCGREEREHHLGHTFKAAAVPNQLDDGDGLNLTPIERAFADYRHAVRVMPRHCLDPGYSDGVIAVVDAGKVLEAAIRADERAATQAVASVQDDEQAALCAAIGCGLPMWTPTAHHPPPAEAPCPQCITHAFRAAAHSQPDVRDEIVAAARMVDHAQFGPALDRPHLERAIKRLHEAFADEVQATVIAPEKEKP